MSWPSAASRCSVGTEKSGVPIKIKRSGMVSSAVAGQ
jgi:hypothetical protein